MRRLAVVLVCLAALAAGVALLVGFPSDPGAAGNRPANLPPDPAIPPTVDHAPPTDNGPAPANQAIRNPEPTSETHPLADLRSALAAGGPEGVRLAAAELRGRARRDPAVRDALGRALHDPAEASDLRIAAAAILGTLPDPAAQDWLRRAVEDAGLSSDLLPWVVYALASKKDWKHDRVFERLDNPDVVETPSGLQINVSAAIDDRASRERLRSMLMHGGPPVVQEALVFALRHSLGHDEVRESFLQRVGAESDRGLQGLMGAALARWAGNARPDQEEERHRIGRTLFGLAEEPEGALLRLQLEPYTAQLAWPHDQGRRLARLAEGGTDFDQRYWAIQLLGRHADRLEAGERAEAAELLAGILARETNDKLREKAAAALPGYADRDGAAMALAIAVRTDGAWNVRLSAARALGKLRPASAEARAALEDAALRDAHEAVRAAAAAALK